MRVLGQGTSRGTEGPLAAGEGVDPEPQTLTARLPPQGAGLSLDLVAGLWG